MKVIGLECCCGASIVVRDDSGSYVQNRPDNEGRKFQIEVVADKWLALHKDCRPEAQVTVNNQAKGG